MNTAMVQAVTIGAIAGATPTLVALVGVDPPALVIDLDNQKTWHLFYGYALRCGVLMFLGAFLVYVNSETDKWKAFQMGILAPTIIIGIGVAGNLRETSSALRLAQDVIQGIQSTQAQPTAPKTSVKVHFALLLGSAYAQTKGLHRNPELVKHGATGQPTWFVVVGSHSTRELADAQAKELKDTRGYDARVFPPSSASRYFTVAVGSYLEYEEASRLRTQALADSLPKNTFLMKYGG
jgi:hypothetical protein